MKRAPAEACPLTDARLAAIARHGLSAPMVDLLARVSAFERRVPSASAPLFGYDRAPAGALARRGLLSVSRDRTAAALTDTGRAACAALFGGASVPDALVGPVQAEE